MRNATGEFDHFDAALNVAPRVGNGFSVLRREELGEWLEFFLDKLEKLEHHPRATLRVRGSPGRLGSLRIGDGVLDLRMLRQGDLCLNLPGIGIKNVAKASGAPFYRLATDEMADFSHGSHSFDFFERSGAGPLGISACLQQVLQLFAAGSRVKAHSGRFSFTIG